MLTSIRNLTLVSTSVAALALSAGCAGPQNNAQGGAVKGAALGALAGQLLGGDSEATLAGAAIGGGIGYVIGNEKDKAQAEEMNQQAAPTQDYSHDQVGLLANTRWNLVSLAPSDYAEPYASKIIAFGPSGTVTTTTTTPEGKVIVADERYRVVGDTLIVNKSDYIINATFAVDGSQLIVSAEKFRAVLQKL